MKTNATYKLAERIFCFFFGHFEETDGSIMDIISKLIHSEREKG